MAAAVQTMPETPSGKLEKYVQVKESTYECQLTILYNLLDREKRWRFSVDWADLVTLDLSQFDVPGGKQKLAAQLKDAVHNGAEDFRHLHWAVWADVSQLDSFTSLILEYLKKK